MTTNGELNDVVIGFKAAEEGLRKLQDEADKLQTAASSLGEAKEAVRESASSLTNAAMRVTDVSVQLGVLASQLAAATQALVATDPEEVKRELSSTVEQVKLLKSRVEETAGEVHGGFYAVGKSLTQVKLIASTAMVSAIIAAVLVVVFR